jgi:hypothetical protein
VRKPLVVIVGRTDPTPAVCTLACGHVYTHPLFSGCSSARHYCGQCPEDRADDQIVGGAVTDESVLVSGGDMPDNVVQLVRR